MTNSLRLIDTKVTKLKLDVVKPGEVRDGGKLNIDYSVQLLTESEIASSESIESANNSGKTIVGESIGIQVYGGKAEEKEDLIDEHVFSFFLELTSEFSIDKDEMVDLEGDEKHVEEFTLMLADRMQPTLKDAVEGILVRAGVSSGFLPWSVAGRTVVEKGS